MIRSLTFFCFLFHGLSLTGQPPVIHAVEALSDTVALFSKYEATVALSAGFDNPYDYQQVALRAVITGPGSQVDTVDGFYTEQLSIDPLTGNTYQVGPPVFKFRYAPRKAGEYSYKLVLRDTLGSVQTDGYGFMGMASPENDNKGFIRAGPTNYLAYDDGDQYIPIGENMAWPQTNAFFDYSNWLTALSENGGNYIRLWHAHWGLGIEWKEGWDDHRGLQRYNPTTSAYQDWLYDYCAEKGIYVMLTLQHHGQVSTQVNPNWDSNPYNKANGGPLLHPWEFFTDTTAIALSKNRLRYIVARWGYSTSILCWELFNEVDWTDLYGFFEKEIIDWQLEMAQYLKDIDVYDHLVSTSLASDRRIDRLWGDELMDITQIHHYGDTPDIQGVLVEASTRFLNQNQKPVLVGEFGLGGSPELSDRDPDGIHLHNGMWATLLGGSLGTAMSWWWDSYIHPRDLYYHFNALATVARSVPFLEADLSPANALSPQSAVEAYALLSPDTRRGAGWVLNKNYNHQNLSGGLPEPIDTAKLIIDAVDHPYYLVKWYETLTGSPVSTEPLVAQNRRLVIPIPGLNWDLAFTLESDPAVSTTQISPPSLQLFPNPVAIGANLHIKSSNHQEKTTLSIFNAEGKPLLEKSTDSSNLYLTIPTDWPPGIYWLLLSNQTTTATRPFVVTH